MANSLPTASRPRTPPAGHDHEHCIADALAKAETICERHGARLTPMRRRVLELVWQSHRPVGAYDLLDLLNARGRRHAPIAVYRALDFLIERGLVHRLASRNAFIGCSHPAEPHTAQFLICERCHAVTELEDKAIAGAIRAGASHLGFTLAAHVVEAQGVCATCRGQVLP